MGYTTDFQGQLFLSSELTQEQFDYLTNFTRTRRMKRDVNKLMELFQGKFGYPGRTGTPEEIYGKDGEYFVGGDGYGGQDRDDSIIDYNTPPGQFTHTDISDFTEMWKQNKILTRDVKCQPGLWCQWVVEDEPDCQVLRWDEGEKFYNYIEWLSYLIKHFFEPWGIKLDGEIFWTGEDSGDRGKIVVENNDISIYESEDVYVFKKIITK